MMIDKEKDLPPDVVIRDADQGAVIRAEVDGKYHSLIVILRDDQLDKIREIVREEVGRAAAQEKHD
jgi:hypothetical protein